MVSARPDLNGCRLFVPGSSEVWLMYGGMRHHIVSPNVYTALFSETDDLTEVGSVEDILRGPDLNDGTCLVRGRSDGPIYLVTGFPATDIRRLHIGSWETFVKFRFDEALVQAAPELVLAAVPAGPTIRVEPDEQL